MASAVEFDQQFFRHAREIRDIRTYRLLAAEFVAIDLFVAQATPQQPFSVGVITAEGAGVSQMPGIVLTSAFTHLVLPPTESAFAQWLGLFDSPSRGE